VLAADFIEIKDMRLPMPGMILVWNRTSRQALA
jgi:hypothetical protein